MITHQANTVCSYIAVFAAWNSVVQNGLNKEQFL